MRRLFSARRKLSAISVALLLLFTLLLAACGADNEKKGGTQTTPTSTSGAVAHNATTPTPGIKLGAQPCPEAVKATTYWDPIIPTQVNTSKVESVICANLIGTATLQALITVRSTGSGAFLDVYVFKDITDPKPKQIFELLHLQKADAKVSGYNTVLTFEVDDQSSVNKNVPGNAQLTQDLGREFKWSDGAGTFVPVAFPGLYPDITRYQAEADQQQVNQGKQPWKLNAEQVALNFAVTLLKWSENAQTSVVSGGGKNDGEAVVKVKSPNVGGGTIQVTMNRLEGNTNGGIWIVIAVSADDMAIATPRPQERLSSPLTVTGKGKAFEAVIGKVIILDHTYTDIGQAQARGQQGNGVTNFSANVSYKSTFKMGTQEGIVALYSYSNADGSIAAAVMVKTLLS
jgi:hypothetical protein